MFFRVWVSLSEESGVLAGVQGGRWMRVNPSPSPRSIPSHPSPPRETHTLKNIPRKAERYKILFGTTARNFVFSCFIVPQVESGLKKGVISQAFSFATSRSKV